jgi:hypothetical protein
LAPHDRIQIWPPPVYRVSEDSVCTQQLRGLAGAWWANYNTALPVDRHIQWGKFCNAFCAHHLSAGLLRSKLDEFLELEKGNHSLFNYTWQFNTLAQYGSYRVDTDEKKANPYHEGLTIHLQECSGQFTSLTYNELASATIDQERLMKAVAEADEKKRKRIMPRSSVSGGSSGAPPKYRMVYTTHLGVSCTNVNNSSIGSITYNTSSCSSNRNNSSNNNNSNSSSSLTVLLLHHRSRLPSGHHSSFPLATYHASSVRRWGTFLVNAASPSKATPTSSGTRGQSTVGPIEESCTTDWPCQLDHHG